MILLLPSPVPLLLALFVRVGCHHHRSAEERIFNSLNYGKRQEMCFPLSDEPEDVGPHIANISAALLQCDLFPAKINC